MQLASGAQGKLLNYQSYYQQSKNKYLKYIISSRHILAAWMKRFFYLESLLFISIFRQQGSEDLSSLLN